MNAYEYEVEFIADFFNKTKDAIRKWSRENNVTAVKNQKNMIKYIWTDKDIENYSIFLEKKRTHQNYKNHKPTQNVYTLYKRLERAKKNNQTERIKEIEEQIKEFNKINSPKNKKKKKVEVI